MTGQSRMMDSAVGHFQAQGYVIVPSLFTAEEAARYRAHFLGLRLAGTYPGDAVSDRPSHDGDPLKRYPRMIQMHHWDHLSRQWLLDLRLRDWLTALAGREPYAAQTMLYFKPPGSRGQAFHQDQFFLRVQPGTCIAAWMALERVDQANGCLHLVPTSHRLPLLCTQEADAATSISAITVPVPDGTPTVPAVMDAGDVLFFSGQLIHGSFANTSRDRFRCTLIGHYVEAEAEKVARYFSPLLRMDGREVSLDPSTGGGPCGVWTDLDYQGTPIVEMREQGSYVARTE